MSARGGDFAKWHAYRYEVTGVLIIGFITHLGSRQLECRSQGLIEAGHHHFDVLGLLTGLDQCRSECAVGRDERVVAVLLAHLEISDFGFQFLRAKLTSLAEASLRLAIASSPTRWVSGHDSLPRDLSNWYRFSTSSLLLVHMPVLDRFWCAIAAGISTAVPVSVAVEWLVPRASAGMILPWWEVG